jgi:acetyl esterase/lipase
VIGSPPGELVEEYLPGLPAQLRFPTADGPAPLIVMVPGGGWSSADPTGLIPLAGRLTDEGASTALITYATTGEGSTFPEAVDDVACAVRWSAQQATSHGHAPTHVILLGHSAGGHLASLVTLSGQEFGRECTAPPVGIDGLIGLAGVYDTEPFRAFLSGWMGVSPTEAPDTWRRANPIEWLRRGPQVPSGLRVLLIHGDADESVPLQQTTAMGDALASAQIDSQTSVLPGLGHLEIFEAAHAGPPIHTWMKAWPPSTPPTTGK